MMFLSRLFPHRARKSEAASRILEGLTAQARQPVLFAENRIRDTFDGRFEAIALHSALLARRLNAVGPAGNELVSVVMNRLFSQFDYAYRQNAVGDLVVGKKMRKLAEAFAGRMKAYQAALDGNEPLNEVIFRNLFNGAEGADTEAMTSYVRAVSEKLADSSDDEMLGGRFEWPGADAFFMN